MNAPSLWHVEVRTSEGLKLNLQVFAADEFGAFSAAREKARGEGFRVISNEFAMRIGTSWAAEVVR